MTWLKQSAVTFEPQERVVWVGSDNPESLHKPGDQGTVLSQESKDMWNIQWDNGQVGLAQVKEIEHTNDPNPNVKEPSRKVNKYSPEYLDLLKLIKILVNHGVPPKEIDEIVMSMPFETTEDVATVSAKLWTLGSEVYDIPREVLLQEMKSTKKVKPLW